MANEYAINYEDERFQKVESEKQTALNDLEKTYGDMISESDKYYQAQIDASKQWADKQSQLQQEKTDFAIGQIEQNKAQAKKDYTKEQSGAFVDWKKQSNEYGANAEQKAAQGLQNTGFAESSQVGMWNAYQNRVATARESYNQIVMNFNNSITEARLQNNSILAEIAYEAQKQQLELNLQGFQYKNQLLLDKTNQKTQLEQNYYNRWKDVLSQINTENALAEQIRQFNASLAEEQRQFNAQMAARSSGGGSSRSYSSGGGGGNGTIEKSNTSSIADGASKGVTGGLGSSRDTGGAGGKIAVDTKSATAAGYAGASGKTLANAVNNGTIKAAYDGAKVTFSKSIDNIKNSLLYTNKLGIK